MNFTPKTSRPVYWPFFNILTNMGFVDICIKFLGLPCLVCAKFATAAKLSYQISITTLRSISLRDRSKFAKLYLDFSAASLSFYS